MESKFVEVSKPQSLRLCFRIVEEGGKPLESEPGDFAECYVQMVFENAKKMPVNFESFHNEKKQQLADNLGVDPDYISLITSEEYDLYMNEED